MIHCQSLDDRYDFFSLFVETYTLALPEMLKAFNDFLSWCFTFCEVGGLKEAEKLVRVQVEHFNLLEILCSVAQVKHDSQFIQSVKKSVFLRLNILHSHQLPDLWTPKINIFQTNIAKYMAIERTVFRGVVLVSNANFIDSIIIVLWHLIQIPVPFGPIILESRIYWLHKTF